MEKAEGRTIHQSGEMSEETYLKEITILVSFASVMIILTFNHIIPVIQFENEQKAYYKKNAVTLCTKCHRNVEYGNIQIPNNVISAYNLEEHDNENFKHLQA